MVILIGFFADVGQHETIVQSAFSLLHDYQATYFWRTRPNHGRINFPHSQAKSQNLATVRDTSTKQIRSDSFIHFFIIF